METLITANINEAKRLLEQGQLVAIPTETVYGLAGNALHSSALLSIYATKKRPSFDPLIIHTSSIDKIANYVLSIPELMFALYEAFSPGPITYVVKKNNLIPDMATSGLPTAAFRVPSHPLTLDLLKSLDFPLAAPSANLFGKVSPTTAQHVYNQLHGKIPMILDGGACQVGIESTIVRFDEQGAEVLRLGGLSIDSIKSVAPGIRILHSDGEHIDSPGQLKSHYATQTPLLVGNPEELILKYPSKKIGILSFSKIYKWVPIERQRQLSAKRSTFEAAQNLFAMMQELDHMNLDYIFAEEVPNTQLGPAVNDRLKRASVNH